MDRTMETFELVSKQSRQIKLVSNGIGQIDILMDDEFVVCIAKQWVMERSPRYIWKLNFIQPLTYALKKEKQEPLNSYEMEQLDALLNKLHPMVVKARSQK